MDGFEQIFKLSGQQNAIYIELTKLDCRLGKMYLGALMVLSQPTNPDRFALGSHGLRELMEKLPIYLNLPTKKGNPLLFEKVANLAKRWDQLTVPVIKGKSSNTMINSNAEPFDSKLKEFFDWFRGSLPTRKEIASDLFTALDPLGRPLPAPIEKLHIHQWIEFDRIFQKLSHHNSETDDIEYFRWLSAFEKFLLDQLRPRTFEDHSDIDKIIQEGESL